MKNAIKKDTLHGPGVEYPSVKFLLIYQTT